MNFIERLRKDFTEYYTLALLSIGLPAVAWLYFDFRAAITVFVITHIIIGTLAMREVRR